MYLYRIVWFGCFCRFQMNGNGEHTQTFRAITWLHLFLIVKLFLNDNITKVTFSKSYLYIFLA